MDVQEKTYVSIRNIELSLKELLNRIPFCPCCAQKAGLTDAPARLQKKDPGLYTAKELVTIKEAEALMACKRTKIYSLRKEGVLTTLKQGGGIRLVREEVERAKQWR